MSKIDPTKARLYARRSREKRRQLGLCLLCGRQPAAKDRVTCKGCTDKGVERHRRKYLSAHPATPLADLPGESWKPINGYEGRYEVSNLGRVKSIARINGRGTKLTDALLCTPETKKYLYVTISNGTIRRHHRIHRLVAMAFIPNPLNLPLVNHKDGNTTNNHVSNLEGNYIPSGTIPAE